MNPQTQKLALALSLGMALAACGGGGDGSSPPADSGTGTTTKATPVDTSSDASASANTATQNTTAAQDAESDTSAIFRKQAEDDVSIRGDVLIQALLSHVPEHDAQNQPLKSWLDPDQLNRTTPQIKRTLAGPVILITEDITPDSGNSGLGAYVYSVDFMQGPLNGSTYPEFGADEKTPEPTVQPIVETSVKFGISQPGLPQDGKTTAAPAGTALEIGSRLQQHIVQQRLADWTTHPARIEDATLTGSGTTIDPKQYYRIRASKDTDLWQHIWNNKPGLNLVTLSAEQPAGKDRQFRTCIDFYAYIPLRERDVHQKLCDTWEVPTDWTAGQPLTHVGKSVERTASMLPSATWTWNTRKGTPPIPAERLKTTDTPINRNGISGAVLAAMFDSFTPRAQGMRSLPQRAGIAVGPGNSQPLNQPDRSPQFIGIHHESAATTYADGSTDTDSHSPAVGSYLYVLNTGAWKSETQPRDAVPAFSHYTMAMHLVHDPQKGITLPGWTGINARDIRYYPHQEPRNYQREQQAIDFKTKTIAPNDLILFGSTVQTWFDRGPDWHPDGIDGGVVRLTVEQSTFMERSAELCWHISLSYDPARIFCTTWTIPEGWQPGQVLKPESYYVFKENPEGNYQMNTGLWWNTRAQH